MTRRPPKPPRPPGGNPEKGRSPGKASGKPPPKKAALASNKFTKAQLVDRVADQTGLTKKQSLEAVSAMLDSVIQAIQEGQRVGLPGLGSLSVKATTARTGVRPGTNQKIVVPAGKTVRFKVSSKLKGNL